MPWSISFTALRICRFAAAMPPLAVHPAALMCPPPPNCFASMVAMKLLGLAVDDMIPPEAFGGGATDDTDPIDDRLDPKEG